LANTEILSIPIDDSAFKAFKDLFDEFRGDLTQMPAAWKKLNEELSKSPGPTADTAKHINKMMIAMGQTASHIKKASKEQGGLEKATERSDKSMKKLAKSAQHVGKSLAGVGKNLLKIAGVGLGLTSLGTLGLFGLADSAFHQQKEARGMGVTPGMKTSWGLYMSRFVGTNVLQSVSNAQQGISFQHGAPGLAAISGMSTEQAMKSSPATIAFKALLSLHHKLRTTPHALWDSLIPKLGYSTLGLDKSDYTRINAMSRQQLLNAETRTKANAASLNIPHGWSNTFIQFRALGDFIKNSLIRDLVGLSGPLREMTYALTRFVQEIANNPAVKAGIRHFAQEINKFAHWMGSKSFNEDMTKFGHALVATATGLWDFARAIGKIGGLFGGKATVRPYLPGQRFESSKALFKMGVYSVKDDPNYYKAKLAKAEQKQKNLNAWAKKNPGSVNSGESLDDSNAQKSKRNMEHIHVLKAILAELKSMHKEGKLVFPGHDVASSAYAAAQH
jgi:hypothetical protein